MMKAKTILRLSYIQIDSTCRWYRASTKKTYFYCTKNSPKCCTNSYFVSLVHYSIDRLQLISLFCDEKSTKAKSLGLVTLWIAFTLTPSLQYFCRFRFFVSLLGGCNIERKLICKCETKWVHQQHLYTNGKSTRVWNEIAHNTSAGGCIVWKGRSVSDAHVGSTVVYLFCVCMWAGALCV